MAEPNDQDRLDVERFLGRYGESPREWERLDLLMLVAELRERYQADRAALVAEIDHLGDLLNLPGDPEHEEVCTADDPREGALNGHFFVNEKPCDYCGVSQAVAFRNDTER